MASTRAGLKTRELIAFPVAPIGCRTWQDLAGYESARLIGALVTEAASGWGCRAEPALVAVELRVKGGFIGTAELARSHLG
jgi:hypothetical protein